MYTGDNRTFACGAAGVPAPTISYYFNATLITTGVSDGVLTLTGVTNDANTGPYQCFADNVHADSSPLWVVTVRDPGELSCTSCLCYIDAICDWICKKGSCMHNYKYLEISF